MSQLFENQVVVITGAGRESGLRLPSPLHSTEQKWSFNDLDHIPAAAVVEKIEAAGGVASAFAGDVTDPEFPEALLKTAVINYGKINVLVNNAGYTWDGMVHKMSDEQWDAMLSVHATAPFQMIRAAAQFMREPAKAELKAGGLIEPRCIVNVSSTSGLHGNIGQANYATGKMGMVGLTKTVAKEWGAFGIRCNAVAFGFIETRLTQDKTEGESIKIGEKNVALGIPGHVRKMATQMIPLSGRAGTPKEAAGGILLMASPLAAYITGHTLEVTGGVGI